MASFGRKLARSPAVQRTAGKLLAGYLKFVNATARRHVEPSGNLLELYAAHLPAIAVFWHGRHFMTPFACPRELTVHTLVSRHGDGTINAVAVQSLGFVPIRGAGDRKGNPAGKGGAYGFLALLRVLRDGGSVGATGDVPKVARVFSEGLVKLAQKSGQPIVPIAYVTKRRITLSSWDRAEIPLPFSRAGVVLGEPIYVADGLDAEALETARLACETALNAANDRAVMLAEGGARV
ncbi:MAG: lysophospholipid acyltransferase family protein [Hyphomicrobiaceae bacterium]|nr:lysophospholipid acyltransferase family protein [Hyphomicrobiaceae bacterium]